MFYKLNIANNDVIIGYFVIIYKNYPIISVVKILNPYLSIKLVAKYDGTIWSTNNFSVIF